jgi:tetratricopeptide (TPR) repeat protein
VAIKPEIINRAGYLDRNAHVLDFHVVALTNRAEIHEAIGKADLAERDLDAAVAHKWAAHSLLERGEFLQRRKGRLENALSDLDAATVLDPENPRAHNLRGLVLMRLGRHELALRSFDRAIDLDPYDGYGWRMRALMHRELDQTEEAVRDYEIAMMVDPRIIGGIIPALQHAGYWMSHDAPQELTPEFRDAIRACMLDKTCN